MCRIGGADHRHRWFHEILDRRPFAQKLRIRANAKILSRALSAGRFEGRNHECVRRSREHRAAEHDEMEAFLARQNLANLSAHGLDVPQVQLATPHAGSSHAKNRDIRILYGLGNVHRGAQQPCLVGFGDQLAHAGLKNGAASGRHHLHLVAIQVHADDGKSLLGKASRTHRADVTQSKNANRTSHDSFGRLSGGIHNI